MTAEPLEEEGDDQSNGTRDDRRHEARSSTRLGLVTSLGGHLSSDGLSVLDRDGRLSMDILGSSKGEVVTNKTIIQEGGLLVRTVVIVAAVEADHVVLVADDGCNDVRQGSGCARGGDVVSDNDVGALATESISLLGERRFVDASNLRGLLTGVVLVISLVKVETDKCIAHLAHGRLEFGVLEASVMETDVLGVLSDEVKDLCGLLGNVGLEFGVSHALGGVVREAVGHANKVAVGVGTASDAGVLHVLEPGCVRKEGHAGLGLLQDLEHLGRGFTWSFGLFFGCWWRVS